MVSWFKKLFIATIVVVQSQLFIGAIGIGAGQLAYADAKTDICNGLQATGGSSGCTSTGPDINKAIRLALNILALVAGVASVFMIIIAGIRFITSGGDPSGVKSAKQGVLYAIIGLLVVLLSQAIIAFVINNKALN